LTYFFVTNRFEKTIYRRGKSGGLNEAQIDSLLVDFDKREEEDGSSSEAGSEVDESLTIPKRPFQRTISASEDSEVSIYSSAYARSSC